MKMSDKFTWSVLSMKGLSNSEKVYLISAYPECNQDFEFNGKAVNTLPTSTRTRVERSLVNKGYLQEIETRRTNGLKKLKLLFTPYKNNGCVY